MCLLNLISKSFHLGICGVLQNIVHSLNTLEAYGTCSKDDGCSEIVCSDFTGDELRVTIQACHSPPAIELRLKDGGYGTTYLHQTFTAMGIAIFRSGAIKVTLNQLNGYVGLQVAKHCMYVMLIPIPGFCNQSFASAYSHFAFHAQTF